MRVRLETSILTELGREFLEAVLLRAEAVAHREDGTTEIVMPGAGTAEAEIGDVRLQLVKIPLTKGSMYLAVFRREGTVSKVEAYLIEKGSEHDVAERLADAIAEELGFAREYGRRVARELLLRL